MPALVPRGETKPAARGTVAAAAAGWAGDVVVDVTVAVDDDVDVVVVAVGGVGGVVGESRRV